MTIITNKEDLNTMKEIFGEETNVNREPPVVKTVSQNKRPLNRLPVPRKLVLDEMLREPVKPVVPVDRFGEVLDKLNLVVESVQQNREDIKGLTIKLSAYQSMSLNRNNPDGVLEELKRLEGTLDSKVDELHKLEHGNGKEDSIPSLANKWFIAVDKDLVHEEKIVSRRLVERLLEQRATWATTFINVINPTIDLLKGVVTKKYNRDKKDFDDVRDLDMEG